MSSTKDIENLTAILNSIPEFLKTVTNMMQTPSGWLILGFILIWFLLNKDLSRFLNIFEEKEKKRLDKLEVYVSNKDAYDEEILSTIKDLRDAYYFKVATGIYAEKKFRDSLINLHKKTSHVINWINIKRAMPYIEINSENEAVIREQYLREKIGYIYNITIGWISLGFATASFLVYLFSTNKELTQFAIWIFSTFSCVIFAIFSFSMNFSIISANKIKVELKSFKNE